MSYTKKRKTASDTSDPSPEQSRPSPLLPKHVYAVQSLSIENSGEDWDRRVEGIFTYLSEANDAALDIYNDHGCRLEEAQASWVHKAKPESAEVEREGPGASNIPHEIYADDEDIMFCPRKRSDGGMRFGGTDDEGSTCVVWVERMRLN